MSGQNEFACGSLSRDGTVHEPDDAAVRLAANDREFTEVFVERHEDASLVAGSGKNSSVTRIGGPGAGPDDIVPGGPKHLGSFSRQAGIEEQPHDAEAAGIGSHRS